MKWTYLLLIPLLFIVGGCTKFGKNITVRGQVLNPVTGEGIPNVQIQIVREGGGIPGGYKEVKSTTTDEDGNFEISKLGCYSQYYIQAQTPYYPIGWKENGEPKGNFRAQIDKHHVVEMDYHTVPYGQLSSHIKNENCEGSTDDMQFRSRMQWESDWGSWSTHREGCYDVSSSPSVVPMGWRFYETMVIRPSGTYYVYDTVFVSESGVSHIEILY